HQPAVIAGLVDRVHDVVEIQISHAQGQELKRLGSKVLQVDVTNSITMRADQRGRVSSASRKVRRIWTEADPAQLHNSVYLVWALHDCAEMRMERGAQP